MGAIPAAIFVMGFRPVEDIGSFRGPENGDVRNKNPPTYAWVELQLDKFRPLQYGGSRHANAGKVIYG